MKNNECGRSLTEMLGILAVISILSVTGVYGYGIAMRMYKTNELIRELNFRANQVATQLLLGSTPESVTGLESAFLHSGEYTFAAASIADSEQFKITVTGTIPEEICRQLYMQLGDNTVIRAISGPSGNYTSSDDCEGEHRSLSFVFNNDMSTNDKNSQPACNGHGIILDGSCSCYSGYSGSDCNEGYAQLSCGSNNTGNGYRYTAPDTSEYDGCLCKKGYYGPSCENSGEQCNAHGRWFAFESGGQQYSLCICEDGYTGESCAIKDGECHSNLDCDSDSFCSVQVENLNSHCQNKGGQCVAVNSISVDKVGSYYYASQGMNYDSAYNFCHARGGTLLNTENVYVCPDMPLSSAGTGLCGSAWQEYMDMKDSQEEYAPTVRLWENPGTWSGHFSHIRSLSQTVLCTK